jgi:co-chaperonin GroES (HSP10)
LAKHVYVRWERRERTASGIYLPQDALEATLRGRVIQTGPECDEQVQVEDTVLFTQAHASEVNLQGNRGWVFHVPVKDILVVEEP